MKFSGAAVKLFMFPLHQTSWQSVLASISRGYFHHFLCFPLLAQTKKKLAGLTKEHEALFNFVESNKHICTEKEKQKVELR